MQRCIFPGERFIGFGKIDIFCNGADRAVYFGSGGIGAVNITGVMKITVPDNEKKTQRFHCQEKQEKIVTP